MRTGMYLLIAIVCSLVIGSMFSLDVYHTTFFYMLMICLCINTLLCSGRRFCNITRRAGNPPPLKFDCQFSKNMAGDDIKPFSNVLKRMLESAGYKTAIKEEPGRYEITASRGLTGVWGMLAVHLSIVFIAAGALYGAYAGGDATVELTEGLSYEISDILARPFVLRLEKFRTEYYDNGMVSDWISTVAVEQNGRPVAHGDIKINEPLDFRGIKVYLASQGVLIRMQVLDRGGAILNDVQAYVGDEVGLAGAESRSVRILRYIPDYDPSQPMVSKSPHDRNPYIIFDLHREGLPEKRCAIPINEAQYVDDGDISIIFPRILPVAGLHVKYDPGLPFLWVGFGMLAGGFFLCSVASYCQVWIRMLEEDAGVTVSYAARGPGMSEIRDKIHRFLTEESEH